MTAQLYCTRYKEQFCSPGRVQRTELRPTSAHRRNNPQPRPDFLFPHNLLSLHGTARAQPYSLPPVDTDRPPFPPMRHFSFHSPVATRPDNSFNATNAGTSQNMPPINASDRVQKVQLMDPPPLTAVQLPTTLKNPQNTVDHQKKATPLSAPHIRVQKGARLQARPQTNNPLAASHCFKRTHQSRGCCSNGALDFSDCYSCFHVVRPYQAGHYIIHPEFVSESLR
uniref:Uncharacterized protein n=1 Tax=Nothobranchius furzeri TaxID=105023 RepID=A0A1A8AG07_NOTFU